MAEHVEHEDLVNLTIDGRAVSVPKGSVIWQAASKLGIEIPIYCYHPRMDPLGACRMCFVEVEKMPKLATACTTTVAEGMVVRTDTPKVKKGRQGTLEFLLINHPLDCPVCDKGGECDLQDFTLRYGPSASRFDGEKRHFPKPVPVSENILLDRERCIACQRCVRFCQDVAMENGLIMEQRGFRTQVGTNPGAPFDSIYSGNVVEMCPVGALTAKSYRFTTRPWELRHTASVCGMCSVGCNVRVDVRVDKVLRQYSRANDAVDDGWLCDRGRWDLALVNSAERLQTPLIRRDGELRPASWDEALKLVALRLSDIARQTGGKGIGGIGSTHTTNEESYLFQKLFRAGLGSNNVDHFHGHFPATQTGDLPWVWSGSIAGLEKASHIILLGTDTYTRQPIIDLRIRKAIRNGARVYVLTPEPARLDRLATQALRYQPGQTAAVARALLQAVLAEGLVRGDYAAGQAARMQTLKRELAAAATGSETAGVAGISAETLRVIAREIASAGAATILYDEMATREPGGETLASDVRDLALLTDNFGRPGASAGPLFEDNNSLGARDMGVLPDSLPGYRAVTDDAAREALAGAWEAALPATPGLSYEAMLAPGALRGLYVLGADPVRHLPPEQATALKRLEFLVVQDLFLTETAKYADVVLPAVAYTEKDGTFTNTERAVQVVRKAMIELPGARADWQILLSLARLIGLPWQYLAPSDVLREIARTAPLYAGASRRTLGSQGARWPLIPAAGSEGQRAVSETPYLTWDQLERGITAGESVANTAGGELAVTRGRGE